MRLALALGVLITACVVAGSNAAVAKPPRVTVIADSAFRAVVSNQEPLAILDAGFSTEIDVRVCRRLTGTSCPSDDGLVAPTVIDVVRTLGPRIAPTVIVEVGYNDFADTFPQAVEDTIDALLRAGVTKILWTTLAEQRPQYVPMNQVLAAAAGRHPEVDLVDWAGASRGRDGWFQADGVHLSYDGAIGMARLLHAALVDAIVSPLVVSRSLLPTAHAGKRYSARLTARGGVPPYRWQLMSGPPGDGLHFLRGGLITGTPRRATKLVLSVRLTDAVGQTANVRAVVTVARG